MYISNLKIENYRNFRNFKIDLQPFTLLIGENNAGKTNLLDALGLIFSQEITFFKKRFLEIDDVNYLALKELKGKVADESVEIQDIEFPSVKIEVLIEDLTEDQEAVAGDWFVNKDLTQAMLTYAFRLREGWQEKLEWLNQQREKALADINYVIEFPIKQFEYILYGGGEPSNKADPYFLRMFKMELLDALRDTKRELAASSEYKLLHKILVNRDENKFADVKQSLLELQDVLEKHPEINEVRTGIEEYLKKVSLQEDEQNNSVEFNFSSPEAREILKKLSLNYGNDPVGVERNGLGRNNLLFISLVLSHLAGESFGANFTYFRLVGVEEPESHLHPHLQDHLAKNIKNERRPDMQLILTSHSTHIASKLDLDNTFILFRDEQGETHQHPILKGIDANSDSARYLKKFLDATNSTMFFAKKAILIEGISEQLLIPEFFEKFTGKTLEKIGCNILNVAGVSFKHFLEIIKNGYSIKCLVLTDKDRDEKTEKENRAEKLKVKYQACKVIKVEITRNRTFEQDIIDANKTGGGKNILLAALEATKPKVGNQLKEKTGISDLNIDDFFKSIEPCKSEFAFNLVEKLRASSEDFIIPDYIRQGFEFITKNGQY